MRPVLPPSADTLSLESYAAIVRLSAAHEADDAKAETLATLALRYDRAPKGDNTTQTTRPGRR